MATTMCNNSMEVMTSPEQSVPMELSQDSQKTPPNLNVSRPLVQSRKPSSVRRVFNGSSLPTDPNMTLSPAPNGLCKNLFAGEGTPTGAKNSVFIATPIKMSSDDEKDTEPLNVEEMDFDAMSPIRRRIFRRLLD